MQRAFGIAATARRSTGVWTPKKKTHPNGHCFKKGCRLAAPCKCAGHRLNEPGGLPPLPLPPATTNHRPCRVAPWSQAWVHAHCYMHASRVGAGGKDSGQVAWPTAAPPPRIQWSTEGGITAVAEIASRHAGCCRAEQSNNRGGRCLLSGNVPCQDWQPPPLLPLGTTHAAAPQPAWRHAGAAGRSAAHDTVAFVARSASKSSSSASSSASSSSSSNSSSCGCMEAVDQPI